jgi:uncharacterized membrane protein HdeD (DUF308 family)
VAANTRNNTIHRETKMKTAAILGLLLIILGIVAFGYQGVIWVQGREEVARVGPVEVQREKSIPVPIAPILGTVAIVGGVIMLVSGRKNA